MLLGHVEAKCRLCYFIWARSEIHVLSFNFVYGIMRDIQIVIQIATLLLYGF